MVIRRYTRLGIYCACISIALIVSMVTMVSAQGQEFRRIPVEEYVDKMKAGWIGQIAGVSLGDPTEFEFLDKIIPEDAMPIWKPSMLNGAFGQDDLYVEMTFLRSMEQYGLDISIRQAGIDFANSGYPLWCANNAGRHNLRMGIAPPDSSHPEFNRRPNDIDYQIEADYSGLIAPGMPNVAVALGEKFGRLMNYGDGVYAGQFIGAMYAEAFFETDIVRIIEAGLEAIPAESQYAEMVGDMLAWSKEYPTWQACWERCQKKYREDPEYQKASNGNIDCKINGAYVLMGLLYGKGDLDQTMIISCRCGMDSDCNPSSSAGVLFTTIGFSKLPDRFTKNLNETEVFSHTAYNIPALLDACEKLARQAIVREGGRVEKGDDGDVFIIPVKPVKPSKLELSWAPGPIAESRFTEAELAQIDGLKRAVEYVGRGWAVEQCGTEMEPGFHAEERGRKNILVTHPLDEDTPCVLSHPWIGIPAERKATLALTVGHHPEGDWDLIVRRFENKEELFRKTISESITTDGWVDLNIDLSKHVEENDMGIVIELCNQPTGWSFEAGYWAKIAIETE